MKIKLISDIHFEFYRYDMAEKLCDHLFPKTEDDKNIVLVLAGDIFTPGTMGIDYFKTLINRLSDQYRHVIYIPGNHEFYHSSMEDIDAVLSEVDGVADNYTRLHCMSKPLIIDDIAFVGDTLWTEVDIIDGLNEKNMADYNIIYDHYMDKPIDHVLTNVKHDTQRMGIDICLENNVVKGMKKVLVSHHGPSPVAEHPRFKGSEMSGFFHNKRLNEYQMRFYQQFDLILYGHTHWSHDTIDPYTGVRTVANCYGYPNEPCNFDGEKIIEI